MSKYRRGPVFQTQTLPLFQVSQVATVVVVVDYANFKNFNARN